MSQPNLTIGNLASQAGSNVPTIRYYEQIGLIPAAQRAANGHRYYREADLKRLLFIKRCRDFGFPIEQVRNMVSLFEDGDRACIEVRDLAQVQLDEVRSKIAAMRELECSLAEFVGSCDAACSQGLTRSCAMIEDLSAIEAGAPGDAVSCCAPAAAPRKLQRQKGGQ